MFDLEITTIHLQSSRSRTELPGFWAAPQPRRKARQRVSDQLFIFLTFESRRDTTPAELVSAGEMKHWFEQLSAAYYNTAGAVTSAMRAALVELNQTLLDRNLRVGDGMQMAAYFQMGVLHNDVLYLAQSGPVQTFVIGRDHLQTLGELQDTGHGLGVSRGITPRFYTTEIHPGDALLLSPNAPSYWTPQVLQGCGQIHLDGLRRRLIQPAINDLQAALIRMKPGSGEIHSEMLPDSPARSERPSAQPVSSPEPQKSVQPQPYSSDRPAVSPEMGKNVPAAAGSGPLARLRAVLNDAAPAEVSAESNESGKHVPEMQEKPRSNLFTQPRKEAASRPGGKEGGVFLTGETLPGSQKTAPEKQTTPDWVQKLRYGFARFWTGSMHFGRRSKSVIKTGMNRLSPDSAASTPLSPAILLLIAIVVPLIVAAVAGTIYFQRGRTEQQAIYFQQARQAADHAAAQSEAAIKRANIEEALSWLDKADEYGIQPASSELRQQMQTMLDKMDGMVRVAFHPAVPEQLDDPVNIVRMVSTPAEDIYLLDASQGRILRLVFVRTGFEVDPSFKCAPGKYGEITLGNLVDLVVLPLYNEKKAAVAAVDSVGNMILCGPDMISGGNETKGDPLVYALPVPDSGWGQITAIAVMNDSMLFVLDPSKNAVWQISGTNGDFVDKPELYFENDDIQNVQDVIDMTTYNRDLYMLHSDGRTTGCTSSELDVTRCSPTMPYRLDAVQGSGSMSVIPGVQYTQLISRLPPEPSLFYLDQASQAIYHYSLQLNLQKRIAPSKDPQYALPNEAVSTFEITQGRRLLLAFGNQVYYGDIP